LIFTVLFESASALYFLYFRADRERLVAAFLLTTVPLIVTAMLRVSHAYDAVVVASFAAPLLVLGLYVAWSRLAWAQKQS